MSFAVRRLKQRCFLLACVLVVIGISWLARPALAADSIKAPKLIVPIPGLDFKQYPVIRKGNEISIPFLAAYIGAFYKYIVGASAIAAAVMIVWGGFLYIFGSTSGGTSKGKEKIRDALIGLALILGSYTVLESINPSTLQFKPLTLTVITPQYLSHVKDLDGVPLEDMKSWDRPDAPPPGSTVPGAQVSGPTGGVSSSGTGKGCAAQKYYTFPESKCSSFDSCKKLFCDQKNYDFEGMPKAEELVGFDDFPVTVGEQIAQKGLTFLPPPLCLGTKGCDAQKYQANILLGPNAPVGQKNRMLGGMRFRVEARDGLIKAGQAAKAEGYFLAIGDGTRTMQTQAQNWCQRIQDTGSAKGMATPGLSPHQLGIAVDIGLFKIDGDNKYHQLTLIGDICHQVETQQALGPDNLKKLEQIMASAGFKHLCSEVWHFDFKGVYGTDCDECDFPGKMGERVAKDKTCAQ